MNFSTWKYLWLTKSTQGQNHPEKHPSQHYCPSAWFYPSKFSWVCQNILSVCQEDLISLSGPKIRQKSHQSQRDQLTSGVSEVVRVVQSPQLAGNLLLRIIWAAQPLISTQPPLSASHNYWPTVASRPKHWGRTKRMKHSPPAFAVNTTEQPTTNATKTEWIKDAYYNDSPCS